jgi:hypothetical protein
MLRSITTGLLIAVLLGSSAASTIYAPLRIEQGAGMSAQAAGAHHACCPKLHALLPRTLPLPAQPCGDHHRCCFRRGVDAVPALVSEARPPQPLAEAAYPPDSLPVPPDKDLVPATIARGNQFQSYADLSMTARN